MLNSFSLAYSVYSVIYSYKLVCRDFLWHQFASCIHHTYSLYFLVSSGFFRSFFCGMSYRSDLSWSPRVLSVWCHRFALRLLAAWSLGDFYGFCLSSLSSFSGINPQFFLGSYFSVCKADCCSWKLPFLRQTKLRISTCLQDVLQMLLNHRRAGTYSKEFVDDVGTTFICVQCPLGSAQPYGASLACEPCSFGTYQDELGHLSNNCWYLSSRQTMWF